MKLVLNLSKIPNELIDKNEAGQEIVRLRVFRLQQRGRYNATHAVRVISDKKFAYPEMCGWGWEEKYDNT